jgi:hypothetical protein
MRSLDFLYLLATFRSPAARVYQETEERGSANTIKIKLLLATKEKYPIFVTREL